MSDIDHILSLRHANGGDYWATADGRLLVGSPFSTIEALLILHELGVGADHEAVRGALDLLLAGARQDGRFRIAPKGALYPCHTANITRVLCRYGLTRDERVLRAFKGLFETPHDDGGWRCNRAPMGRSPETDRSNPGVTLFVLDAFRFTDAVDQDPRLDRAVETLLDHWEVRVPLGPCTFGIGTLFMQTEYPFLRYNLFAYVYVLSFYRRARADRRFRSAYDTLEGKLDDQGLLVIERPHAKLSKLDAFAKGKGSAAATRRLQEIRANMER